MPAARTPRTTAKPGDFTAIQKQKLEQEHAQELAKREAELTTSQRAEQHAKDHEVIDYFKGAGEALPEAPKKEDDGLPYRDVRIKVGVDQMAYGREIVTEPEYNEHGELTKDAVLGGIRYFDFEEGRQYRLPRHMADYLDAKGFIFH